MKKVLAVLAVSLFVALVSVAPADATEPYTWCEQYTVTKQWPTCPSASPSKSASPSPSVSKSTSPSPSQSTSASPSKSASASASVSTSVTASTTLSPTAPTTTGSSLPVTGSKTGSKILVLASSGTLLIAAGIAVLLLLRKRDETKFITE